MKKIISFLLVVCVFFSIGVVLTACGHEHAFGDGKLVLPPTDPAGVMEIATCTECGEEKETLIPFSETTEEKWREMLAPTNYTVTISYGTGDEGVYIVTEDGYLTAETRAGFEQYILREIDGWYSVALVDGEYRHHKILPLDRDLVHVEVHQR